YSESIRSLPYNINVNKWSIQYLYTYIKNVIEYNSHMLKTNNSFLQDEEIEPPRIASMFWEWPILLRGLRMNTYINKDIKNYNTSSTDINNKVSYRMFYMFGNPFVWYLSLICIILTVIVLIEKYQYNSINGVTVYKCGTFYYMSYNQKVYKVIDQYKMCDFIGESIDDFVGDFVGESIEESIEESVGDLNCKDDHLNDCKNDHLNDCKVGFVEVYSNLNTEYSDHTKDKHTTTNDSLKVYMMFTLCGYLCHFLPFLFVKRVTYFHHYFPALVFKVMSVSGILQVIYDWACSYYGDVQEDPNGKNGVTQLNGKNGVTQSNGKNSEIQLNGKNSEIQLNGKNSVTHNTDNKNQHTIVRRWFNILLLLILLVSFLSFSMFRKCVYGFKDYSEMWDIMDNWDYIERGD
ncbi:putative dolichyl-phosphate-mannose:protein O-mannosyl transferase, partial [Pseudoloma neurophilia]